MPGYKRRLSSTSIAGSRPGLRRNSYVEEMVDEEWVERRPDSMVASGGRQYLDQHNNPGGVLAKRHVVRFRQVSPSKDKGPPDYDDDDDDARHVTFEEEQGQGRYSLEVEDSVTSNNNKNKQQQSSDDDCHHHHRHHHHDRKRRAECCSVEMDEHQHCHDHSGAISNRAPVIIVPQTDESTHCEHCQFLSGWFCCIPFVIFVMMSLIVVYMCFRQRINRALEEYWSQQTPSPMQYGSTEPMRLEQSVTTSSVIVEENDGTSWNLFRPFGRR